MRKDYTKPVVEKVNFEYSSVVAASGTSCSGQETFVWYATDCKAKPTGGQADLNVG